MLMGRPTAHGDGLDVNVLAIPRQEGTSDTCTTTHEEELVQLMLERDLVAVGWIHTHPTQTVFMSSLDLHTHAAYQATLPEVCLPSVLLRRFGLYHLYTE